MREVRIVPRRNDSTRCSYRGSYPLINGGAGPQLLFTVFLFVCVFGGTFSIFASATILRIMDVLSPERLFRGELFVGHWADYLIIAANRFSGSDLNGIEAVSRSVMWAMTVMPYISMTLLVFLILAFSTVFQSRAEKTMAKFGDATLGFIDQAAKQLSARPEVIVITERSKEEKKKTVTIESKATPVPSEAEQSSPT